jgi:CRISPR-associated endoribonuclease Cas6
MRIKITLSSPKAGTIDFNYQHQIQAIIYEFLAMSDPDYAAWLHTHGFVYDKNKSFKFFVFSGITFHGSIKINNTGFGFYGSSLNPFILSFQIASPVDQFIQHLIDGIFRKNNEIKLGNQKLTIYLVETLPNLLANLTDSNAINGIMLKPLESPIFIKKPMPKGERDLYLFPDDNGYEEYLNQNLIHKYETLYGKHFKNAGLKFEFHNVNTKLMKNFKIYKNGIVIDEIKGTLQPFTVKGPKELIKVGLECGFGQNNSMGCGYVEVMDI